MTITREQIEMYASAADATQTFEMDKGKLIAVEPEHMQELARMALAGMEAEPVAYIGERMLESLIDGARSCGRVWPAVTDELSGERRIPLYKDTQPLTTSERAELENYRNAQQVVPDVIDDAGGVCCEVSYADGWNACRAAMLQGKAEPVTTAYKLAEGWVSVHTEIPPQGEPLLICTSDGVVQWTTYGFDGENWLDWGKLYDPVKVDRCDLWQRMPAAPQQESE